MIGRKIVHLKDFAADADKLRANYGKTNRFSAGERGLNDYLGDGYGRYDGYEIVLLFGATGIGKSTFALNMLKDPIIAGERIGMLVLEDDGPDVFIRVSSILGNDDTEQHVMKSENIHFMPPEDMQKSWKLAELLAMIEEWYTVRKIDLILLDHLQFAFESAEAIKGENEYIAQRVFMQKLNQLMKRLKKTIIIVSHTNKGKGVGMDKVVGSGAIAQAATKVIEVERENDQLIISMHKSRFTKTPTYPYVMEVNGMILTPTHNTSPMVPGALF